MWEQTESGQVKPPFEPVILAATLAMIPVLIIEADATSEEWRTFAKVANWTIWAVFAVEIAAVLIVAPRTSAAFALRLLLCEQLDEPGDAPAPSRFRAGG
jgi:hypothetical protein